MIYVLIMTIQSTHVDGGLAIHSIDFVDKNAANVAGRQWKDSLQNQRINANYVVVEKP
jgi:hypothetical protein